MRLVYFGLTFMVLFAVHELLLAKLVFELHNFLLQAKNLLFQLLMKRRTSLQTLLKHVYLLISLTLLVSDYQITFLLKHL